MPVEPFLINPPKTRKKSTRGRKVKLTSRKKHRPVLYEKSKGVWARSAKSKSRAKGIELNPVGEVLIVGSNPVKRKRRKAKKNTWSGASKKHAVAARKGWRRKSKAVSRRRVRRNPAAGAISLKNPMSLLKPVAVGFTSHILVKRLPEIAGVSGTLPKMGIQAGIILAPMFAKGALSSSNAKLWVVVGIITALSDVAENMIFNKVLGGLGAIEGAYPDAVGYGAFPEEVAEQGESSESLGAFPYDEELQY